MPRPRQDRGFALLITIVLLAFLVLLLVTLAGTTRVETQVVNNSQALTQARSNALMALNVAIGQLQLYAGPDQRVTTNANFGTGATSGASGLVTPVQGSKQWVGVWGNSQPATNIYAANPSPVFLNWLVSGNEQSSVPTVGASGNISSSAATPAYLPSAAVSGLTAASTATSGGITVGNSTAVLLVGNATAGNLTAFTAPLDRYVVAPLVAITSSTPGLSGNATVGHYAWWVGDEGVKAQFTLRDQLDATDDDKVSTATGNSTLPATIAALYQLSVPGRNAFEILTKLGSYPINDPTLDNTLTAAQFPLTPNYSSYSNYLTSMSDFVGAGSWGVLANSQSGGLRTDLTQLFNEASLPAAYSGQPIIGTVVTGNATTATQISGSNLTPSLPNGTNGLSPVAGATWDTLKSYYNLSQSVGAVGSSTAVPIRVAVTGNSTTAAVVGVSPVIVQSRLMFTLRCAYQGTAGSTYTPTGGVEWYVQVQPVFVIGNPYPFPITASGGVEFSYGITTQLPMKSEWGLHVASYQGGSNGGNQTIPSTETYRFDTSKAGYQGTNSQIAYYPLIANTHQLGTGTPGILNGLRFATGQFTLQPGQCLTYTLSSSTPGATSTPASPLQLQSGSPTTNYYEFDTGAASQLNAWLNATTHSNVFVELLAAEGMTLQMAMPGSAACDSTGALPQPQSGVLQDVVNADLSANNASYLHSGDYYRAPPFPGGMDSVQNDNINGNTGTPTVANYLVFVGPNATAGATTDNYLFSPQGVAVGGYVLIPENEAT